ncbi:MAG TPA: diguanylate cyclase [Coriobacteriia bacterium]|nr:diguanylate cyclase [Coriobacteriia bacterium]
MPKAEGSQRPRVAAPVTPLFSHASTDCAQCWTCARHCPAHAIKTDGSSQVEILDERCVKCGLCVIECPNSGQTVRDDLGAVRALLESDITVVALLSTEYVAALHPLTTEQIEQRLHAIGFTSVETTVLGEEIVAATYERLDALPATRTQLRSTCPVAVSWVRTFHPGLVDMLAPVVPPYIAQSRLIRMLYPEDTAIVYVSPCWARKDEVYEHDFFGDVDVAIGFDELRRLFDERLDDTNKDVPARRPRAVKQISVTDGFPRRVLAETDLTRCDVLVVRGLNDLDGICTAIGRGEVSPRVVDMLSCEGCIDGPCVNNELSVFTKRAIDAAERRRQPPAEIDSRAFLSALPVIEVDRIHAARPPLGPMPSDAEIDAVLAEGEFSREDVLDCGACGYPTCVAHAMAIWDGRSTWHMCFPLERRLFERERIKLSEAAVLDPLTGLMNRRAFDRRITEEVARTRRYGSPLSLCMMDLDSFKEVNDRYGHSAGDALLRAVAVLLKAELRAIDVAVRYGGDEFAMILPNTHKTDAWAVAEKIRDALQRLTVTTETDAMISSSASIGIASVGEATQHANDLLDAADRALYVAKRAGRNRVELAPG